MQTTNHSETNPSPRGKTSSELQTSLFSLPIEISIDEQKTITQHTVYSGYDTAFFWEGKKTYLWKTFVYRKLDRAQLPPAFLQEFIDRKRSPDFLLRHRSDLPWVWSEDPVAAVVKKTVERLNPYILKLNRVQSLMQRPGWAIQMHNDLVPMNRYPKDGLYEPFQSTHWEENDFHQRNRHLTLKVPLTMIEGHNGEPLIEENGSISSYDAGRNVFCIDEVNVNHGSRAAGHWRGVLLIDAELDTGKLLADQMPITKRSIHTDRVFRRVMLTKRPSTDVPFPGYPDNPRPDCRAVFVDYMGKRLSSPAFLGAVLGLSADRLTFKKLEFWTSEYDHIEFWKKNRVFIDNMVNIYEELGPDNSITVSREGHEVAHSDLSDVERRAILTRMFIDLRDQPLE